MANQVLIPPSERQDDATRRGPVRQDEDLHLLPRTTADESLWSSLRDNVRSVFFPEKLPPLKLTSRPVVVRDIWGEYNYKKQSASVSLVVHILLVAGLIGLSIMGARAVKNMEKPRETVELIAPDDMPQLPMTSKKGPSSGGGGGGGDRDKLQAPKGKLPKQAIEQITPPAIVIRNDNPKLPVEPTVVVPPQIKLANVWHVVGKLDLRRH